MPSRGAPSGRRARGRGGPASPPLPFPPRWCALLARMPPTVTRWLPRSAVALLVVAAAVLAWREGGGADARVPPPRAEAAPAGKDDLAAGHGAVAYQVTTRLIDALATARIDAPSLPAATQLLQPHWRKMNAPWTHLSGVAAQIALTLSLRTSRDFETQW